jgi:hypothetical protein
MCMSNTKHLSRSGRHLVLVDIENIVGSGSPTDEQVRAALVLLAEAIPGFSTAQRVWACSHRAAMTVGCAALADRHLWRSGADGADLALLEVMDTERVEDRYTRVTVCSGDGIFAHSIARLVGHGVAVDVVGRRGHVSTKLRLAAPQVSYLPQQQSALGTAS